MPEQATTQDWRTMPAGRELDAIVAERVMGQTVLGRATAVFVEGEWSIHPESDPEGWACYAGLEPLYLDHCLCDVAERPRNWPCETDEEREMMEQADREDAEQRARERARFNGHVASCLAVVPRYSTDRAAALHLLDLLVDRGWSWQCELVRRDCYHVLLWPSTSSGTLPNADLKEETLALAVCRAALEATEVTRA